MDRFPEDKVIQRIYLDPQNVLGCKNGKPYVLNRADAGSSGKIK